MLSYLPQIQGQCVSIASFDRRFYCIVARIVAVRVGQDDVLGKGKARKTFHLLFLELTSGPRTRFFKTVLTAAVAFYNEKRSTLYMLDFSFDKPVQIQDFLDQLPQSWQHRQRQNHTGGELLTGTTWTLEMRDDVFNSIYIHCMASLICETFYTLCFIVFFSSLCQTLKHYSLLSPNP